MLQAEQTLQNRYQLRRRLSQRAGRQTWLAEDSTTQLGKLVVVKLLTFSDQVQWDNLRLFEREAQVLRQLKHPRIPKYHDYFCIDDQVLWFGLVQEYIPGWSLKELLAQGEIFTETDAHAMAKQLLDILIYLHELNPPVLHRDIKPSNVIWGKDRRLYLIDFGAVQDRAAHEGATFTVVGTYGYAPLEQFGGRATPASDLYALGATLIHVLTGIAPADLPQKDSHLQFANQVKLHPGFVRWLGRLTDPNLEKRFSMARQALETLQNTNAASTGLTQPRPLKSRIQLKKLPDRLEITIPAYRFDGWYILALASLIVLVYGFLTLDLPLSSLIESPIFFLCLGLLMVGLVGLAKSIILKFRQTYVYFNNQTFEIEWRLFGVWGRRRRGQVLAIDQVCRGEIRGVGKKVFPTVTIAVGIQEYTLTSFAPELAEAECRWLVQEIRGWLGLT